VSKAPEEIVWQGRYITTKRRGPWEYVGRARGIHAAVIVAIEDGHVLLVEQWRVALQAHCLELPAGLVGDEEDGESIESSAARELEEETGYRPERIEVVGLFASSPGMLSETFTLVRAHGLSKVSDGGGVPGENITVHRIALEQVDAFIRSRRDKNVMVDAKLLGLTRLF
jgi:ADP-ribose pyrophosphatase